jgi:hypothetical protein
MKELVEYIARSLVNDPTQVKVVEIPRRGGITVQLSVAKEDMGRVIGRQGRVANAIRALLRVVAANRGTRVYLDVVEPQ